jgi:hypothetical protein
MQIGTHSSSTVKCCRQNLQTKEPIAPTKVNFSINSENLMPTFSINQVFVCIDGAEALRSQ